MSSTLSDGAASAVEEDAVASVDASVGAGAFRFFAIRFASRVRSVTCWSRRA
jgi:hypothetical protein